jgi:hypothetical protein
MSAQTETSAGTAAIRPFTVPVTTDAELERCARVAATRRPDQWTMSCVSAAGVACRA